MFPGRKVRGVNLRSSYPQSASHHLRTPITSLEGFARMLDECGFEDPETAREGAATNHKEASQIAVA
jgi:signal transduction histidine kinase